MNIFPYTQTPKTTFTFCKALLLFFICSLSSMTDFDFAPQERHAETKSCSLFVLYWCKKARKNGRFQFFRIALKCRNFGVFSILRQVAKNGWGLSIPVRVITVRARKQRNIAVSEFLLSAHFGACPLFVRYCSFW